MNIFKFHRNFRYLKLIIITFGFLFASPKIILGNQQIVKISEDNNGYIFLKINDQNVLLKNNSQSLKYFAHPGIKDNIFSYHTIKNKIKDIGKENIEDIINNALEKEIDFNNTHLPFYNGSKIDLLIFQDILKFLYESIFKTNFNDFLMLRIPNFEFEKYDLIQNFISYNSFHINDNIEPYRKLLISVNPSLFGNNVYRQTSSAFCYFLSSSSAFFINSLNLLEEIFNFFSIPELYKKYYTDLLQLYNLLTTIEKEKTGILTQILIPKNIINKIVYRSLPKGIPYYSCFNPYVYRVKEELELYNDITILNNATAKYIDEMQFRILFNKEFMLNSKSNIKIFRYFNKTNSIKNYEQNLNLLKEKLSKDLKLKFG